MCGICASILLVNYDSGEKNQIRHLLEVEKSCLQRRGPDSFHTVSSNYGNGVELIFEAAVLHLRGTSLTEQPITDQKNTLLWNGEIFGGLSVKSLSESDTSILFTKLVNAGNQTDILQVMSSVQGPYAFVFYQGDGLLWFGRDIFGRRSLLIRCENNSLQICSSGSKSSETKWEEVPTVGLFCLDLNHKSSENHFVIHHYPWLSSASGSSLQNCNNFENSHFIHHLNLCVQAPIRQAFNKMVPTESCEHFNSFSAIQCNEMVHEELFQELLALGVFGDALCEFEQILSDAVKKRVENELGLCKLCYSQRLPSTRCQHASVGVLYSGGLDSLVIACLTDRHLPKNKPVDLINVAFSSSCDSSKTRVKSQCIPFSTPDRLAGQSGLEVLKKINPSRQWNFVKVNVSKEELVSERQSSISHLLRPSCTVLDDSIGCALWFAARGRGTLGDCGHEELYTSMVRVLLVGMGADEQLAGYSRHRAKFNLGGWSGLIDELCLELDRIGSRNLGRDDRVIADHGVEARFPFLDENVVSFLNGLPVWLKADLRLGRGVGEKLLLRLLAFKMGLAEAAFLPKRAIQFGSRIAKIENSKEKGSDPCVRLSACN